MTTDRFEIIDMHMHTWPKEWGAMLTPYEPAASVSWSDIERS